MKIGLPHSKGVLDLKKLLLGLVSSFIFIGFLMIGCHLWIEQQTQTRLYSDLNALPPKKVALVLGTVKRLRRGYTNPYFQYRIDAAVQLYKAGKIKHLLVSGDNNTRYYNEPIEMRKALILQGIPPEAITLDYAGFRTLDSIIRAKEVFSQNDFIIVSQAFHNERALFICDYYGIKAIAFNARDVPLEWDFRTPLREYFARLKAVLDLYILQTKPKFLGEKVSISI